MGRAILVALHGARDEQRPEQTVREVRRVVELRLDDTAGIGEQRRQLAEERAAKTAVQLIFPLVLFIFPGIFVVLVGPAAIQISQNLISR